MARKRTVTEQMKRIAEEIAKHNNAQPAPKRSEAILALIAIAAATS